MNANELDQIEADVKRVLKTAKEGKWSNDTFNYVLAYSILKAVAELRAAPALLAALEMVIEAAAVYSGPSVELTPGQLEIRRLAKVAGMTPNAYVMNAARAATLEARGE